MSSLESITAQKLIVSSPTIQTTNEDSRKAAEKNLSTLITKWKSSLTEDNDSSEFKEKLNQEDKLLVNQLKCRVHSDLQTETVRECNVYEAYKQILILIDRVKNSNDLVVPIAVLLCPLQPLVHPVCKSIKFHHVDVDLVARCHRYLEKLESIRLKTNALLAGVRKDHRRNLRMFVDATAKYQKFLKKTLKKDVSEARTTSEDDPVETLVDKIENELIMPSKLQRWLFYELCDIEIVDNLLTGGISFVKDWSYSDHKLTSDRKYTLLLSVPSLPAFDVICNMECCDEVDEGIHADEYDDCPRDGDTTEDEEEKEGIAFLTSNHKQKLLESKIREWKDHLKRNEGIENQVQLGVSPNSTEDNCNFCYVLYDYSHSWTPSVPTPFVSVAPPPQPTGNSNIMIGSGGNYNGPRYYPTTASLGDTNTSSSAVDAFKWSSGSTWRWIDQQHRTHIQLGSYPWI